MNKNKVLEELFGENPYQKLVDEIKDFAILHIDLAGIIFSWNSGAEAIFGYAEDEAVGQNFSLIFTSEDNAENIPALELETAAEAGSAPDIRWHIRKDGSSVFANGFTTALRDSAGNLTGFAKIARDDSDRKLLEDRMRESEELFRHMGDTAPVLIWMAGLDKKCFWFNKPWLDFTGRTMEEEYGNGWAEGVHPDDFDRCLDIYFTNFDARKPFTMEYRLRRNDGEYRWVLDNGMPRFSPGSEFSGFIGSCIDITEMKVSEELLRRSEAGLRLALEGGEMGTWRWGIGSDEIEVDDKFLSLYGLRREEFDGKTETINSRIHPEDFDAVEQSAHNSAKSDTTYQRDFRVIHPNGEVCWIAGFGRTVYSENGEPVEINGVNFDITERKRSEIRNRFIMQIDEAVRPLHTPEQIATELARNLAEHIGADRCAYAEVEEDEDHFDIPGDYSRGDVTSIVGRYSMSQFGKAVLGLMRENRTYVVNDVNTDKRIGEADLAAYRLTEIQAVICVPLHKNGRFSSCMAVHQTTPRVWTTEEIELVTFVANRFWESIERAKIIKSLHESLEREKQARQSAEKANAIKDEFLATVSHELRTPLNAILGWSTLLRDGKLNEEGSVRAIATVDRNARAQSQLIDDLLDISRIITGKLRLEIRTIDLATVIETAVDSVRPAADAKNIRLQVLLDSKSGPVSGDADRLQQIFWNLLSNAVKFTPKGGRVEIRLERINSHVTVTISDTGKGISPDLLQNIFVPFWQADQTITRREGGLGLGLSIVRTIVEMHGGTIRAQSEGENTGTTFSVELPRLSAAMQYAKAADDGVHPTVAKSFMPMDCAPELDGLRALIVDDEPDSLDLLREVLEICGSEVTTARSVAEALAALETGTFDVLVSDIGMPDEDGYSLIAKLRAFPKEKGGRIPAVALTAYARVEDRVRALNAGFQVHVPKPVEPVELAAVVASLAKGMDQK